MKIAVMQPYYYPYLGYFQLINSVDVFVNLDHVNFKKRSYMTRNILQNNIPINVQVVDASQNKKCLDTKIFFDQRFSDKFLKKLSCLYSKSKHYIIVMDEIITPTINNKDMSISEYNFEIIERICNYLNIKTKLIKTSIDLTSKRKKDGIIEIVKKFNGLVYVNPIGGVELYDKDDFENENIQLSFIKMKTQNMNLPNPYVSILDLIFNYDKEFLIQKLNEYEFI